MGEYDYEARMAEYDYEALSDEKKLAVLLSNFFNYFSSFIEERDLGSEFAKWMIHNKNEAILDLIKLGGVSERLTGEAEGG